jgi:hypothetical protein
MSIVLNSKTYNPDGFDSNGVSNYSERSAGVPSGFSGLAFGQTRTDMYVKGTVRLTIPIVATTDSDCSCAGAPLRVSRLRLELEEPVTGTLAERQDLLDRIQDLVATAQFESFVLNLVKPTT